MRAQLHAGAAVAAWTSLALLAAGCAGRGKEDTLPQDGPTMMEVYRGHLHGRGGGPQAGGIDAGQAPRPAAADGGLEGYSRGAADEIQAKFKRLPNPDLVLYVFPHLSERGYPVPGYATLVPMYEHVEYALPGEAEGW